MGREAGPACVAQGARGRCEVGAGSVRGQCGVSAMSMDPHQPRSHDGAAGDRKIGQPNILGVSWRRVDNARCHSAAARVTLCTARPSGSTSGR